MDDTETGRIIPFPLERARRPPGDEARLVAALASLEAALAEQRTAMAGFRASLGALSTAVGTLAAGVAVYSGRLATLRREVDEVNGTARALETWADGVLARAR